jgi:hypothetical protein
MMMMMVMKIQFFVYLIAELKSEDSYTNSVQLQNNNSKTTDIV